MTTEDDAARIKLAQMSSAIVSSYVSHNAVNFTDLPKLLTDVFQALSGLRVGQPAPSAVSRAEPAVPIKRSVTNSAIVCLEDGLKFKSLKRHIESRHKLTPEQYRDKWHLPSDYPMVAPSYSEERSQLAKASGLGKVSQAKGKRRR